MTARHVRRYIHACTLTRLCVSSINTTHRVVIISSGLFQYKYKPFLLSVYTFVHKKVYVTNLPVITEGDMLHVRNVAYTLYMV